MHDVGLTRIPRNADCFEVEGAEIAGRFLRRHGLPASDADRVTSAIVLHMRAGVTLADGVESVLLDRATSVDVRGDGYAAIAAVRDGVMRAFPRGPFDRHFLRAIEREVARRGDCQSARLLHTVGTIQGDQFQLHAHPLGIGTADSFTMVPGTDPRNERRLAHFKVDPLNSAGIWSTNAQVGSETRPVNAYVNYLIKP